MSRLTVVRQASYGPEMQTRELPTRQAAAIRASAVARRRAMLERYATELEAHGYSVGRPGADVCVCPCGEAGHRIGGRNDMERDGT
jgi:hypothetical protein